MSSCKIFLEFGGILQQEPVALHPFTAIVKEPWQDDDS